MRLKKSVKIVLGVIIVALLAGVVVLSLPILIMFLCLQKQFVEGVVTSGIKG